MAIKSKSFGTAKRRTGKQYRGGTLGRALDTLYEEIEQGFQVAEAATRVIWRPASDPGEGYVTTWAEAVEAVQKAQAPTEIFIENDPWDDGPVHIPGGYWELNDTLIVGRATYAHGGQNWHSGNYWSSNPPGSQGNNAHRGAQILQEVYTQGNSNFESALNNPCRIVGCRGLKNIFFRGEQYTGGFDTQGHGDVIAVDGDFITLKRTTGPVFSKIMDPYRTGGYQTSIHLASNGDNHFNGWYSVTEWIDENTVKIDTGGSLLETGITWQTEAPNAVFWFNEPFGKHCEFTLINTDFRSGGSDYGSLYAGSNSRLFLRLEKGSSIRWYAIKTSSGSKVVVQSDGSPCWIGSYAFGGDGYVKAYAMPGTEFHTDQDAYVYPYNSIIFYKPGTSGDWAWANETPQSVQRALDLIAAHIQGA